MLHTPSPKTPFYRVTDRGRSWLDVLSGAGAYFSFGGRYNRVQQKTVYASEDPLVAIAEYAFHQAIDWQRLIGGGPLNAHPPLSSPGLPLVSEHALWCFTLDQPPAVVDVEHPVALHTFGHQRFELLNPSFESYHRTAMLADRIRHYPSPGKPVAGGLLVPSVRTPVAEGYTSRHYVIFLPHNVLAIPGALVRRWKLTLEFRDTAAGNVSAQTRDIDWTHPWFRLTGARSSAPAYPPRPGSQPYASHTWHQIEVRFA